MAISGRLARRLHETLGAEAGEDLVTWMQGLDTQRWEFRELHEATTARFEARLGEAEARLRGEILAVRHELTGEITDVRLAVARVETAVERRYASLLRWSFTFWITTLVALAGIVVTRLNRAG